MIEYLNKSFGRKTGSSIFFFLIALVTVSIPDWDLATGKLLLHRSILTHSILIPFLLDHYSKKYSSKLITTISKSNSYKINITNYRLCFIYYKE